MVVLRKIAAKRHMNGPLDEQGLLHILGRLRREFSKKHATLDIVRGVMLFEGNHLYLVKPLGRRFWTRSAAVNDADEIATTILMQRPAGVP